MFGTLVWWLFLAFNAVMAMWIFWVVKMTSDQVQLTADGAQQAGTVIGGTMATGFLLGLWLVGSLILGLIVALTRGKTVTIEKTVG